MTRYTFALADPESASDDAQLRRRMAADWMDGSIALSFRREPSYFAGCRVQGESVQVVKCTDSQSGEIVGMGSRALRRLYVNGVPQQMGYLADLRGQPAVRNGTLLARGYKFLRQLHDAAPVPLYYSVILDGNQAAMRALVGGRAGLPQYRDFGLVRTPAIHLDLPRRALELPGITIERTAHARRDELTAFLSRWQSQKQLAPCWTAADFGSPRLLGLDPSDFYLAIRRERIVGCVAAWDQRAFRQTHVERYSGMLARMRPFYNALATVTPLKRLPAPGSSVPYFYLSLIAIEENDPAIFRVLLRTVYRDRRRGPWHYFIAGLHERDPLAAELAEYRRIETAGRLFIVHYPDGADALARLDDRIPYVEMAAV